MHIQKKRTLIQTISLFLLHSSWGLEAKWFCNPVLSCHSCVLAWFACPLGVLVHYSAYRVFPLLALGTVLVVGILIGRLVCGWVCPFGFLQDLLHKIPVRKFTLPEWTRQIKYVLLGGMIFLFPFLWGENTLLSFCRVCPASALQVTIPNLIGGSTITVGTAVKLGVTAAVLVLVIFAERGFCKVLCPLGALLAPLNHLSFWEVKVPKSDCLICNKCDTVCVMDVKPSERMLRDVSPSRTLDCVVCHECQLPCPHWSGSGYKVVRSRRTEAAQSPPPA